MVCRRVGGFHKGSEKGSGVPREGVVGIGVQGSKEVKGRGSVRVCIRVYNFR